MKITPNLGLKKPGQDDFYNVDDFNYNMDILDNLTPESIGAIPISEKGKPGGVAVLDGNGNILNSQLGSVPVRSVNSKTGDVVLTATDIGAETPAGAQAKANQAETNAKNASVPITRTVNGLALSSNIALNHNHVGAVNAVSTGSTADPNTTQESYILTNHANSPGLGVYWHIHTYFYSSKTGNRAQQAISYNGAEPKMFIRHNYGGSWTAWQELGGGGMSMLVDSSTLQESFDAERSNPHGSETLVAKLLPKGTGIMRVTGDIYCAANGANVSNLRGRLLVVGYENNSTNNNGFVVPNGISWQTNVGTRIGSPYPPRSEIYSTSSTTWQSFTRYITVASMVPVYVTLDVSVSSLSGSGTPTAHVRNLRFYYDVVKP